MVASSGSASTMRQRIQRVIVRPSVLSVFLLVFLWNLSVSSNVLTDRLSGPGAVRESLSELRDLNLHVQMRFYQMLTHGRPVPLEPQHVTLVYLDDDTHWTELKGVQPTSRKFLAQLLRNLVKGPARPSAIALDVELLAPMGFQEGTDDASRAAENQTLLEAVQFAAQQGVPVVLGGAFVEGEKHTRLRLPLIYTEAMLHGIPGVDCEVSQCPASGYLNAPVDKRQIPPAVTVRTPEGTTGRMNSLALATVEAVRRGEPGEAREEAEPEFGSFLPEERFPSVSAMAVLYAQPAAIKACDHRIVLVGGHWHEMQGYGGLVDEHLSPAGRISGLALHANYVESLLQHQYASEPALWVDILLDVLLGLVIYVSFALATGWRAVLVLAAAGIVPVAASFLFLWIGNLYLDFLLPLELFFLHILYEVVEEYAAEKRHHSGPEHGLPETRLHAAASPAVPDKARKATP